MKRRLTAILLCAAVCLLCGCGSVFNKEYVVVSDYVPAAPDSVVTQEKITVRNLGELKTALLDMVYAGERESKLLFDAAYDGDATEDLALACWQVRTQDAMCAYCVENIAYDLAKIVTHYEAGINISYSAAALDADSIVQMQYSTGLEETIRGALEEGQPRLVVLLARSIYSAEEMESIVGRVYRQYPAAAPKEPQVSVNMFSGTGRQRLYEIQLHYGLLSEEMEARRAALAQLEPFAEEEESGLDSAHKALLACSYLIENCRYVPDGANDVYAALIERRADSEGMALAYVELCRRLALPCQIVYGQRSWENHCWNIVEIDGASYHVDPVACVENGIEHGFLLSDEEVWASYRWDVSAYPVCAGELHYADLLEGSGESEIDS